MPYTLLTRTAFSDNMLFIGVPPKDILEKLLQRDSQGENALDKKRNELLRALQDPGLLEGIVNERIAKGEFDLNAIGETLLADMSEPERSKNARKNQHRNTYAHEFEYGTLLGWNVFLQTKASKQW